MKRRPIKPQPHPLQGTINFLGAALGVGALLLLLLKGGSIASMAKGTLEVVIFFGVLAGLVALVIYFWVWVYRIAEEKGYPGWVFVLAGLAISPFLSWFIAMLLPINKKAVRERLRKPCPECSEMIMPSAKICPHCKCMLSSKDRVAMRRAE